MTACPTRKVRRERALSSSASASVKPDGPHRRRALNSSQWSTYNQMICIRNAEREPQTFTDCGVTLQSKKTHLSLLHAVGSIEAKSGSNPSQVPADGVGVVKLDGTGDRRTYRVEFSMNTEKKLHILTFHTVRHLRSFKKWINDNVTYSETWSRVSLPSSTDTRTLSFTCSAARSAPAGQSKEFSVWFLENLWNWMSSNNLTLTL